RSQCLRNNEPAKPASGSRGATDLDDRLPMVGLLSPFVLPSARLPYSVGPAFFAIRFAYVGQFLHTVACVSGGRFRKEETGSRFGNLDRVTM
ncbi:MAG: hypothetical protein H6R21_3044, partial [Proteobacteria bacterium]|nr:hypothetical protein [Pseudomonadota bacterium]